MAEQQTGQAEQKSPLSGVVNGYKFVNDKLAWVFTAGGLIFLPFWGNITQRYTLENPDASVYEAATVGWISPLITSPETGEFNIVDGLMTSVEGIGFILTELFNDIAPIMMNHVFPFLADTLWPFIMETVLPGVGDLAGQATTAISNELG